MAKLAAKPTSKQITNNTLHDHVEDLWAINEADEYHGVKKAVMEAQSKPPTPQLLFPEFMKDSRFRHGITTSKAYDEDAKKLIYANEICEQTENTKQPWSQRRRNYNWPSNTNPETTIFGIKSKANAGTVKGSNGAGVAEALCMNGDSHVDPEVKAINTFAFGKPTSSSNSSTAECLGYQTCTSDILGETDPTEKDDIGKSLKPGYRNVMTTRCFGCPSIRTDIPNNSRSIADTQNYGEDLDAGDLLRPSLFSSFGLEENEFIKPRSKGYLKKLFRSCGLDIDECTFEQIFKKASDANSCVSIQSFTEKQTEEQGKQKR